MMSATAIDKPEQGKYKNKWEKINGPCQEYLDAGVCLEAVPISSPSEAESKQPTSIFNDVKNN